MIPIGQTQSVTKGLAEFAIGEVGGFVGGQAGYHGTKLLGGSEADAERATFVGSILGGFAASSAASKFSLNKPIVNESPYKQQILKNIEESRLARESSKFDDYLRKDYALQGKYFAERVELPNGKRGYLSADITDGKPVPVRSRSYLDSEGHIKWPPKGTDGFVTDSAGNPITEPANLKAGQFIDRYGNSGGRFTSPLENGQKLPYETRGLPYPEGYQPYHKYEVVVDLTEENILKAYNEAPQIIQEKIKSSLNYYGLDIDELINIRRGEIAKVFGQGGGTQIQFGSSINYYEDLGLIREVQ
ncbi:TPA: TNT domain-containing protein [Streptococcus suis]|nr:TNT domain-containing protein [Streptococcus suis]HEM3608962.1 TNT domain-containing protein [Streptococcus suis]HEM3647358.1 TNT domain-containing protein [Streptococcus suis]HEM3711885.1 TNT domain-containing protein [Streptococcus suis]